MGTTADSKIKVAVLGATGYTGQELVRLLAYHQHTELHAVSSRSYVGKDFADVFPNLRGKVSIKCCDSDIKEIAKNVDLIFIALPHGEAAAALTSELLDSSKVIDLGADFRLLDPAQYKEWYHLEHPNPSLIAAATYGLSELNRDAIKRAKLVANPGCYATCSILALAPLLKSDLIRPDSIIIDAKSGVSGAGRGLALGSHFNECNDSIKAYALATHRHTPEIEQELCRQSGQEITLSFTPHLVPMNRGILVTGYATLKPGVDQLAVQAAYSDLYSGSPFVRIYDSEPDPSILPETRWVTGSNFCDIAFRIDRRAGRVVIVAALDNLVKGAAGQAVQNMNLMFGFEESCGLEQVACFP